MGIGSVCAIDADSIEANFTENNIENTTLVGIDYVNADESDESLECQNGESVDCVSENIRLTSNIAIIDGALKPADLKYLQDEIDKTHEGSTLDLNESLKNIGNENKIINIHKNMTIDGHGNTIDFGGSKNCYIDVNEGNVIFQNIKFINGFNDKSDNGGALYIHKNAQATLINCSFNSNFARKSGGAVYCENKNKLNIYNCNFNSNKANNEKGGAVYSKGDIFIFNSTLTGNHAKEDGGAVFSEGKVTAGHCLFESNTATGKDDFQNYGGAICSKGNLTIFDCTLKNNKADDYAGAAYSYASINVNDTNATRTYFIANKAGDEHGGALYAKGNVEAKHAVFRENIAEGNGGAIYCEGNVNLTDCIIKNNKAGSTAGAVWAKSKITINGCILTQNFNSKSQLKPLYSKSNIIDIVNNNCEIENANYDDLSTVSLNKNQVNFWISDSKDLKELFEFISNKDPSWNIINITFAPNTVFNVDYNTFTTDKTGYGLRFAGNTIIFNGNPGSVIKGNNHKNNFIYTCPDTNVFFLNMNLECFNHCIVNLGNAIAINSSFCDNEFHIAKREKNQPRYEIFGGVMVNYNNAFFENCTFVGNKAIYDGKEHGCWGSILFAESYSQTFLANCKYYNNGDDCFYADAYSTITLMQDHELDKEFKDCRISPEASLTTISYSAYKNKKDYTCVINCSNVEQLKNALYMVNSYLPALSVVINLEPGVYVIPQKWIKNTNQLRSLDWRDEYEHPSVIEKANKNRDVSDKFALDVGSVPITINGNGATIKIGSNDEYGQLCFAFVSYGGHLILNNLTLANFNHVFKSVGTIHAINCTFKENKHYCGKPILWGSKSSTYFINCTFKPVDGRCADSNIFTVKTDSYVKFDNCNFDYSKGKKNIGNLVDSTVECPSNLKNKIWFNSGSVFYNTDKVVVNEQNCTGHGVVFIAQVVSDNYADSLSDLIKKASPNTIVLNITRDCEIDLKKLNFKGNIIVNGNNYNVRFVSADGKSSDINKHISLTINNITFSEYAFNIFDNKGTLNILNCNFTNNTCEYLINNPGDCNFINCTFTDNSNKNILYNKGSLNMEYCTFEKNNYTNKALIYNDGGCVSGMNTTFNNVSMAICNYLTPNCVFANCSNFTKCFTQAVNKKMASWKKYLIRGALIAGLLILSILTSRAISKNIGSSMFLNTAICGIFSLGFAYLDNYILGEYETNPKTRYGIFAMYLCVGLVGAIIGNAWGASEFFEPIIEESENGPVKWEELEGQSYKKWDYILEAEFYMDDLTVEYLPEHIVNGDISRFGSFSYPQPMDIVSFKI